MKILAIDTSCDETSAAVTDGRRILAQTTFSQIQTHRQWGGVVPSLAKRAHEERIDGIVDQTMRKYQRIAKSRQIDAVAVTYGPGLAIALEVGIRKAKALGQEWNVPLIAVNHMEGHIYSCFAQNSKGNPAKDFAFPYLVLLVSGAHTELVLFSDHITYTVLGETRDDAAGEAIDKAARMLGFGYPGGPMLERLADQVDNRDLHKFPRPMLRSGDLNFSFSGLKTAFLYHTRELGEEQKRDQLNDLASSFQSAVFETLVAKTVMAAEQTGTSHILVAGGVAANMRLRLLMNRAVKKRGGTVQYPVFKYMTGDNAGMIGVAAHYKAAVGQFVSDPSTLDRVPRLSL